MALRPSGFYDFFNICLLLYLLCTLPVSLKTSTCFISTSLIFRAQRFAKYNLAYSVTPRDDEPQFYFDIFVDACLAFDIMMSMCRYSYDSKTRELITDAAYIRTTYLQSWFIIDLVSVIPFDYVMRYIFGNPGIADATHNTRLLRLTKLTRFAR